MYVNRPDTAKEPKERIREDRNIIHIQSETRFTVWCTKVTLNIWVPITPENIQFELDAQMYVWWRWISYQQVFGFLKDDDVLQLWNVLEVQTLNNFYVCKALFFLNDQFNRYKLNYTSSEYYRYLYVTDELL